MRIRIVKRAAGEIDGVQLRRFDPGYSYDVSVSIGTYLVVRGFARAADMPAAENSPPSTASANETHRKGTPFAPGGVPAKRRRRTPSTSR